MSVKPQGVRWAGTFAALSAAAFGAGCSVFTGGRSASMPATPVVPPAANAAAAVEVSAPAASPTISVLSPAQDAGAWPEMKLDHSAVVNMFGEVAGKSPRRAGAISGDASFQQHTACDEGYDADAAVDPSGKWLVFSSTRHSERPDVYLQRVDGTSVMQLTTDPADDAQPAFSPDGKHVAFCSTRSGNWDIYLMDVDGRSVQQVTNTPGHDMHPSFSPDGSKLVYCALSPRNEQWELWTIDLNTSERRMIGHGLFPVWSPQKDVDRIAFQRARQRGSRWFSLWTLDLVEGEPRKLTEVTVSSSFAVVCPTWSPDGSRLAFAGVAEPEGAAGETGGHRDVWVVNADGAGRQKLTDGTGSNLAPTWGVDNRLFFISDRGGNENVWSVRVDPVNTFTASARPAVPAGASENTDPQPAGQPEPTAVGSVELGETAN